MQNPKLLLISGSLRTGSYNRTLLRDAAQSFGPAKITEANIDFPLYNGDDEDSTGVPQAVKIFARQIKDSDAMIVSSPEYNKGISGVLKNALDWVSRVDMGALKDKPTVVMSAAAGRTGGETALFMTLSCLSQFQVRFVFGPVVAVAAAGDQFDSSGRLKPGIYKDALVQRMEKLRNALA